jgi:cobalamin biosynthesis protein CobD/CbiB
MINILQNVTKDNVLLQLKRIAVGALVLVPLILVIGVIAYLISSGYINANTAFIIVQVIAVLFMLWNIGGAYESYSDMKRNQKEYEERKTLRAFERLGNGNT